MPPNTVTPYDRTTITLSWRQRTLDLLTQRDGPLCHICAKPLDLRRTRHGKAIDPLATVLDHLNPLRHGGADAPDNWRLAHWICNNRKSEARQWQR